MRPSARSTRRRDGGFTLVEMIIVAALFALVLGVALQGLLDSTQASTYSTVQADLRRIGQDVLSRMAQDIRCTQAQHAYAGKYGGGAVTTGDTLDLQRVTGFNGSTSTVSYDTQFIRYSCPTGSVTPDGRYGILRLVRGTAAQVSGATLNTSVATTSGGGTLAELCRELEPPPGGFQITAADSTTPFVLGHDSTAMSLAGPLVAGTGTSFTDEFVRLKVKLVLRRLTGLDKNYTPTFVTVHMQTEVTLRPDANGY